MTKPRDNAPPAVVIGLGVNGLGTVRSLSRRGIRCIAIMAGNGSPSEQTRYGEKIVLREMSNPDALVECLLKIGERFEGRSIVFPSGDLSLATVSGNRDALSAHYHFPMPSHDVVELILDKSRFYAYAQEHGLPLARTYFPRTLDEAEQVGKDIAYPCVIKPSIATPAWRDRGLKILPAANRAEFTREFQMAWSLHQNLIVQEVTPGPDSALYFSLAYLGQGGDCRAMFTGRKLRQYVPQFGISSMAESLWSADVDRLSRETFARLDYTGYGSVEFKKHSGTGELLITEVTGRTWYPHALSEHCGINLPYIAYSDLVLGARVDVPQSFPDHVKWIDEVGDTMSAMWYWKNGELSLADWLRSYGGERHWALAASDDLKPFLSLVGRTSLAAALMPARMGVRVIRRAARGRS